MPPPVVDVNGEYVEYFIKSVNSREQIDKLIKEIFTKEEIEDMKGLSFYIQFLALPSGELQSASFLFLHGDPQVNVNKLVEFSNQLKQNTTLTVKFDRDIEQKGLVGWAYRVFPFPE